MLQACPPAAAFAGVAAAPPLSHAVRNTNTPSSSHPGPAPHPRPAAFVRVRPAFAGEGRYFVRVPKGTNCGRFKLQDEELVVTEADMEAAATDSAVDAELERAKVELYMRYLEAQVRMHVLDCMGVPAWAAWGFCIVHGRTSDA